MEPTSKPLNNEESSSNELAALATEAAEVMDLAEAGAVLLQRAQEMATADPSPSASA
jgi:hypothetical protein